MCVCACVRVCDSNQLPKTTSAATKTDKQTKEPNKTKSVGGADGSETSNQSQRDFNTVDPRARLDTRFFLLFLFLFRFFLPTNDKIDKYSLYGLLSEHVSPADPTLELPLCCALFNCYFRVCFEGFWGRRWRRLVARWLRRRFWTIFNLSASQIENCQNC